MSDGFGEGPFGGIDGYGEVGQILDDVAPVTIESIVEQPTDPVDLELDDDGDLLVDSDLHFTSGLDSVAQGIKVRMLTFKGEWFLDLEHGVPYYQDINGQKFNEVRIRAAFRDCILSAPGVNEILELEINFDRPTRELSVDWVVKTIFGLTEDELVRSI